MINHISQEDEHMSYVDEVMESVRRKDAAEPEFLQAVSEVLESLRAVVEANEEK